MKLEDQVCTVPQAARLKALGISQKALFYHHPLFGGPAFGERVITTPGSLTMVCNDKEFAFAAFTVAELGIMLPPGYDTMRTTDHPVDIWRGYDKEGKDVFKGLKGITEADVRAQMVIYLLENEDITAKEVNGRLTP